MLIKKYIFNSDKIAKYVIADSIEIYTVDNKSITIMDSRNEVKTLTVLAVSEIEVKENNIFSSNSYGNQNRMFFEEKYMPVIALALEIIKRNSIYN